MMKLHAVVLKGKDRTRRGRGFSRAELKEAGIAPKQALKSGVPIDLRRNTKHNENVKILKQYLRSSRSEKTARPHVR